MLKIRAKINKMSEQSIRWCFNTTEWNPSEKDILLATSCVQKEEKDRLSRFVFKKDFKSSLIGRLMMRKFASEALNFLYNEIKFQRNEKDKPVLIQPESQNLAFNVSHQGDYAILAGELGTDVIGADVMKFEFARNITVKEYFRLMNRTFSEDEWSKIKSYPEDLDQIRSFHRHWALKESYVKALGVGITVNLQEISFKVKNDLKQGEILSDTELHVRGIPEQFRFEESLIGENHCAVVALPKEFSTESDGMTSFREIKFEELVANAIPLLEEDERYCRDFFKKLDR